MKRSQAVLGIADMSDAVEAVDQLVARMSSDSFKVLILGEFKRGKSTFINALLGAEILPAYATPCTAVINEVKWGAEKRAVHHFATPMPEELPPGIPERTVEHIRKSGDPVPPLEIAVEDLEEYVAIPDPSKEQQSSVAETPYELVELFWPLEICRNGVEVIDSPGLNEHRTRTTVTTNYLSSVDAVVFVMSCHSLASQSEMNVIERDVRGNGHEDIFFVCNRFDEIRERERARLITYGEQKLSSKTSFGNAGVYFLSALDALDGRLKDNEELLSGSGILALESALQGFLVNERGRIKLLQPARELDVHLKKASTKQIPSKLSMLDCELSELRERYDRVHPKLDLADKERIRIVDSMKGDVQRQRDDFRRMMLQTTRELADDIPAWVDEYDPDNGLRFLSIKGTKAQARALAEEVVQAVRDRLDQEYAEWRQEVLRPWLEKGLESMAERARCDVDGFLDNVDAIRVELGDTPAELSENPVGGWERVLAAGGGFLVGGAGSALVGATLGFKEMAKSLVPQIALVMGAIFLGFFNPFVLIPLLLSGGVIQGMFSMKKAGEKIKCAVGEKIADKLRDDAEETAEEAADKLHEKLSELVVATDKGLKAELRSLTEETESALETLKSGQGAVEVERKKLKDAAAEINDIQEEFNDIVFMLAGLTGDSRIA